MTSTPRAATRSPSSDRARRGGDLVLAAARPQWSHLVFAASQLAGWVLLLTVVLALRDRVGGSRWGERLVVAGCALQIAFAVGYGALSAAQGEPDESVFVLFLAAFLALTVGGFIWGLRIVRVRRLRGAV